MRREVVATIAGLILVALVVVATFLYGNSQREKQQTAGQNTEQGQKQQEQAAKEAEQKKAEEQKQAEEKQKAEAAKKAEQQKQVAAQKQAQANAQAAAQPRTGSQQAAPVATKMPDAGGEVAGVVGAAVSIYALHLYRRSKQNLAQSAKNQSR